MTNKKLKIHTHSGVNMTSILVQNIETFETITTLPDMDAFDAWMDSTTSWGIVSLDTDADGEYEYVALVAPAAGPDFIMDTDTGEMEPVPSADAELEAKLDIMLELDMEETIIAPVAFTPPTSKPRNNRNNNNTHSQGKTMKNHEILASFISANPGVTRATVFSDAGLQASLRSPAQVTLIAAGDKQETKRWNSCINRFIRKIRRDGTDIQVQGMGKTATYTIGGTPGQLELPFNEAAEARNAAIIGLEADEVVLAPVPSEKDAMRLVEEPNQSLDFESLLAQLDDEEATITSDDQVAFKAAQEMIK